jgi:GTP-binding protein
MIDSRLGFTDLDLQLLQLIAPRLNGGAVRLLVLMTKSDKLTRSAAAQALSGAQSLLAQACPEHADVSVSLFSALKGVGIDDAAVVLHGWTLPTAASPSHADQTTT